MSRLRLRMKARKAADHGRKVLSREPYDVVLIVCEGEKTEPYYLESLRNILRLSNTNIRICGKECGSAPISVVNFAIKEAKANKGVYNKVYCVFDKDKHPSFSAAKDKILATKLPDGAAIHAVISIPCFEIWILLHFVYTTRSFSAAEYSSNCALVEEQLKHHIPGYEKGNNNVFGLIQENTDVAIRRAKQLETFHQTSGTDNPSTKVYELIEYLKGLKK
jgi:hypothetical protein